MDRYLGGLLFFSYVVKVSEATLGIGDQVIRASGKFGQIKFLNQGTSLANIATTAIKSRLSKLKKPRDVYRKTKEEVAEKRKANLYKT